MIHSHFSSWVLSIIKTPMKSNIIQKSMRNQVYLVNCHDGNTVWLCVQLSAPASPSGNQSSGRYEQRQRETTADVWRGNSMRLKSTALPWAHWSFLNARGSRYACIFDQDHLKFQWPLCSSPYRWNPYPWKKTIGDALKETRLSGHNCCCFTSKLVLTGAEHETINEQRALIGLVFV